MISRIILELGPWTWWVIGLVLLSAEVLMPGVFLIWIGIAAIIVGSISFLFWGEPFWAWQLQIGIFAVLSVASAIIGRRILAANETPTDEPLLNKRSEGLVGRTAVLAEPIANGRGRIQLDDTYWVVSGPDLPAGTRVEVEAADGRELAVKAI